MNEANKCLVPNCSHRVYAPTGTAATCKVHFLDFLKWRRRKGAQMFTKYAAMTMDERDTVTAEWAKTVKVE